MEFLNGKSDVGKIWIYNERYVALAEYCPKNDSIKVRVMPTYTADEIWRSSTNFFIVFAVCNILFLEVCFLVPVVLGLSGVWQLNTIVVYFQISPIFCSLGFIGAMATAFFMSGLAPWHGAEHKAIDAWERFGSYEMEDIKRGQRVQKYCGTRIGALYMIFTATVGLAGYVLNLSLWWYLAIFAVGGIFFGTGWAYNAALSQSVVWLSDLLQKYITTKEPSEKELRTAQAAIKALVEAHRGY